MRKTTALIAPLLLAAFMMTGCIGIAAQKTYNQSPTIGQQMTDLKSAFDEGAITQEEYDELRAGILNEARGE